MEIALIKEALKKSDGNVSKAAKLLTLGRTTLIEKINKHLLKGLKAKGVPESLKDSIHPFTYGNIKELKGNFNNNILVTSH